MNFDGKNTTADGLVREFPKSLIGWYPFELNKRALFISGGLPEGEVLFEVLEDAGLETQIVTLDELEHSSYVAAYYDYIVGFGVLEKASDPAWFLQYINNKLATGGHILLGLENRLAMRYFVGDKDAFTGRCFDGIDNYFFADSFGKENAGRAYSKAEVEKLLDAEGLKTRRFYSVMPVLENPRLLFAEDFLPNEKLDIRVTPQYRNPATVFLDEEKLYQTLIDNGLFHTLANGYLLEATKGGQLADAFSITSSQDRGKELALYTTITRNGTVTKKAAYKEGLARIQDLTNNNSYLNGRGIKTVEGEVKNNCYSMPFVDAPTATDYFRNLFWNDRDKFTSELDRWMDLVENSSEHVPYEEVDFDKFDPDWEKRRADDPNRDKWKKLAFGSEEDKRNIGVVLRHGYIDLVCLNCFVIDGEFVFYDQEFVMENLPANVIKNRAINNIFDIEIEKTGLREFYLRRYNLFEHWKLWQKYEMSFLTKLRNLDQLLSYNNSTRRSGQSSAINRNRINFTEDEYDKIFKDIFKGIEGKKLYIFGSGKFAEKFVSRYKDYLHFEAIIDNDTDRQGKELEGIRIISPNALKSELFDSLKVFICIKRYEKVLVQLKELGVRDLSVYNPDSQYKRPGSVAAASNYLHNNIQMDSGTIEPKKYKVGYISGVFDLFHIGHVNLFRRAKEQCDYLIVGVVTYEQVISSKKTRPHIPFDQRKAVVESCRYVDEAVRIPPEAPGPEEAYMRYHFDAQFSGSDYVDDPYWLACQKWLRERGADLVFFPYTEETSSSKIKEELRK